MCYASIILPYYKKRIFIEDCIKSILKQTFKKFEILIIYDDEDKKDLSFIKQLIRLDKRIKLIINKKNLGAGESRNIGIKSSKGEYICFLDADDFWKKNKLDKQISFMKKNNYFISHTSYEIVDENKKIIGFRKARMFSNYKELLPSCDIGLSTVIIKKKIFQNGFKFANLKTKEDFVLWLEVLKNGFKIYSLDKNLTTWTKSKNSLSSSVLQKFKDSFTLYNRYMKFNYLKSLFYTFKLSVNFLLKNL
jgi:teichuronic acid biosynthesis glycosyltransferase TuaG